MLSYFWLAIVGLIVASAVHNYRCFARNLAAAKKSNIPYIILPVYTFNRFWLVTSRIIWLPLLRKLPESWTDPWLTYVVLPDLRSRSLTC